MSSNWVYARGLVGHPNGSRDYDGGDAEDETGKTQEQASELLPSTASITVLVLNPGIITYPRFGASWSNGVKDVLGKDGPSSLP
jgi:hypothetical protein